MSLRNREFARLRGRSFVGRAGDAAGWKRAAPSRNQQWGQRKSFEEPLSRPFVAVMQTAEPWKRVNSTAMDRANSLPWRFFIEAQMRSVLVAQVGYKTPIKLVIAKCITVGTPGTESGCTFKSKRDAEAVWYCAACKAN